VGGGSALSGPLLSMTNSSMTLAGSLLAIVNPSSAAINLGTHPLVSLRSGSSLTTGAGPFIAITGGHLTAAALLSTDGSGNVARLTGPGVALTDVTATLGAIVHTSGSDVLALFPASNEPAVELVRTTLTLTVPGVNVTELGANVGAAPTVAGTVLVATDSTVNFSGGSLLRLKAGTFDATSPLVNLSRSTVNQTAATAPLIHVDSAGQLITMRGPLFQAAASTVNASGPLVTFENATVHSTGSGALINVTNSTITTANSGLVDFVDMMQVLDSTVSLAGPLLAVNGGSLTIGAPGSFVDDILFVDSAELTSSGSGPLIAITNAVVSLTNIAANISSSGVSLAGPLLAVSGGQLTTGANLFLLDTSSLASSGSGPLISLTNVVTSIGFAGLELFDSSMTLAGPLLAVSGGQLSMTDALLFVDLASLTSSSSGALISLTNAATSIGAEGFFFFDSTVSLAGPLLAVSGGQLTTGGHLFFLDTAGLTSSGSGALISLTNAVTSIGVDGFDFFDSGMSLAGPLLAVSGGQLTIAQNLLFAEAPATVTSSSSGALFSFTNGANVTIGLAAMHLIGVDTADELVDFFDGESFDQANMTLATDQPLQHGGTFIDVDGATFTAGKGVVVDQALLAASQPLLNMRNSTATINGDAISLINNAKVTAGISLMKLDASTLTVNGHLVSVTGGSLLTVSGDLARLANGSVLNIQGGALLNVGGNSIVKVAGSLLNFNGTGGNAVNVTNTLCGGSCSSPNSFFPNITVAGGGVVSFLDPANAIKNPGLGTLTPAANSAVLVVPAGSVVNIGQ
jgi:hypothetical protein